MIEKHATASTFVFHRCAEGWRLALIEHPRYGKVMIPGGHVEAVESQDEAALREVAEETGLRVRLIHPPSPPLPCRRATRSSGVIAVTRALMCRQRRSLAGVAQGFVQ
jgi:8-oxo-dGTP pyrophosphatase MutT (NUDIX family)